MLLQALSITTEIQLQPRSDADVPAKSLENKRNRRPNKGTRRGGKNGPKTVNKTDEASKGTETEVVSTAERPSASLTALGQLKGQLEFYFSDENYRRDEFLRRQADKEGWVEADVLLGFAKVKAIFEFSPAELVLAMAGSSTVLARLEPAAVRRMNPLPELKLDSRPLRERITVIVDILSHIRNQAVSAPKAQFLLLRKPLGHAVALAAKVLLNVDRKTQQPDVEAIMNGLCIAVELLRMVEDLSNRESYMVLLDRWAMPRILQNKEHIGCVSTHLAHSERLPVTT